MPAGKANRGEAKELSPSQLFEICKTWSLALLRRVNGERGITLLVIEHNMRVIMGLAEHIYCLAHGELLAEGKPEAIQADQRVIDAYLGAR